MTFTQKLDLNSWFRYSNILQTHSTQSNLDLSFNSREGRKVEAEFRENSVTSFVSF